MKITVKLLIVIIEMVGFCFKKAVTVKQEIAFS